jgi:hypothetical protein
MTSLMCTAASAARLASSLMTMQVPPCAAAELRLLPPLRKAVKLACAALHAGPAALGLQQRDPGRTLCKHAL